MTTKRARHLLILLIGLGSTASGATYNVAPNGNDAVTAVQAQSITTPWRTIQKAASSMVAGDTCLIRAGNYRETVTVSVSGTAGAPVTFQAYGSEVVTIDGSDPIMGWTTTGGNIWNAPMGWTLGDGNQILVAGTMVPEARWPNAGSGFPWQNSSIKPSPDWSYSDTAGYVNNTNGWLTDTALPARADGYWNGATIHIMSGHGWIMNHANVLSYTDANKKLVTDDPNANEYAFIFAAGNEFYLTGKKGELDSSGEWFCDAAISTLSMYATATPANVTAKRRNYGFNISGRAYIRFLKLHFLACTIQTDENSTNTTYDGLVMKYLGHAGKVPSIYGLKLQNGCVLRNSELAYDSRSLVQIAGSDIRIINNYFHDSGYVPYWDGMTESVTTSNGLYGSRNLVSHNTFRHSGRGLGGFPGRLSIFEFNDMSDAMKLTTDGAVFYAWADAGNTIIRYNRMHDSAGPAGHSGAPVFGIYLDRMNANFVIHHNIVSNIQGYAFHINSIFNYNMIYNNTCWNTSMGSMGNDGQSDGEVGTEIYNNLFTTALRGTDWSLTDTRNNLFVTPAFVDPANGNYQLQAGSNAIDKGRVIPGVTDGYVGTAPDIGALEYGGVDWTASVGYHTTPPSPDPVYSFPVMTFANQVKDGGFESGSLSPHWSAAAGSNVSLFLGNSYNYDRIVIRNGFRSAQFGVGTSELRQTVTGLLPNRTYKVFGAVQTKAANAVIKLGVRNQGGAAIETPIAASAAVYWKTTAQTFITGPSSTSAEIYLSIVIPAGQTALVYADDFAVVDQNLDVSPSITTQPANQSVTAGLTATFTVVASGTAPLTHQWRKNGSTIIGATSASYTTPVTTVADNGALFSVVITNGVGSLTSGNATLKVSAAPVAPVLQSAVSRLTHGGAGSFDRTLSLSGPATVEPRRSSTGNYSMVFTFDKPVSMATAALTGSGFVSGSPVASGNTLTVNLASMTNAQTATINLTNIVPTSGGTNGSAALTFKLLQADQNFNSVVTASDVLISKSKLGLTVDATTAPFDVNASGSITAADVLVTKSVLGTTTP